LAGSVYVGSIKGISVPETDVSTVEELVRTAVAGDLHHKIIDSSNEADYSVSGKLVKLGEAYSLTLVKTKGSDEVFRATLKSSMMSDMDVVVGRLVRAIDEEVSVEKNVTVKDVTYDEENNQRRRKEVISQGIFSVGPASTSNMNVSGQATLWNLGYNYEVDFDWDMHVDFDWLTTHRRSENDAYYAALNFGLNYYLTRGNFAPFIDAHLGYGGAIASTGCASNSLLCSSKDKASGWLGGLGVGFRFFRTSKTNFAVIVRGSYLGNETEVTKKSPSVGSLMIVGYFH
jgi:hypothetical protein